MELRIYFKVDVLPITYRMLFVSCIKEAIKIGNEQLYQELYCDTKAKPKKYSFAIYLSNMKKKENVFEMDWASMTISSSDPLIAVALINGFQAMKKFTYQQWNLEVKKIELMKEKNINHSTVKFITLSPILLENKDKKPILITDPSFEEEMNRICNMQFLSQYGRPLKKPLKIIDYKMKKQVVQETNSHAGGQTLYYTCQKGTITIQGDIEDLQLIYQDGFIKKKSQGFGKLEVIDKYGSNICK